MAYKYYKVGYVNLIRKCCFASHRHTPLYLVDGAFIYPEETDGTKEENRLLKIGKPYRLCNASLTY